MEVMLTPIWAVGHMPQVEVEHLVVLMVLEGLAGM
jgi:hypothetical protein